MLPDHLNVLLLFLILKKTETWTASNSHVLTLMIRYMATREITIMAAERESFGKYKDETGKACYCPINEVADSHIVSEWELDNCVKASTVQRYSGNLNMAGRNTG